MILSSHWYLYILFDISIRYRPPLIGSFLLVPSLVERDSNPKCGMTSSKDIHDRWLTRQRRTGCSVLESSTPLESLNKSQTSSIDVKKLVNNRRPTVSFSKTEIRYCPTVRDHYNIDCLNHRVPVYTNLIKTNQSQCT